MRALQEEEKKKETRSNNFVRNCHGPFLSLSLSLSLFFHFRCAARAAPSPPLKNARRPRAIYRVSFRILIALHKNDVARYGRGGGGGGRGTRITMNCRYVCHCRCK